MGANKLSEERMELSYSFYDGGRAVEFFIFGELDHYSVRDIREEIDEVLILRRPQKVVINLGSVSFSDSAGLGLILGRYNRVKEYGGEMELCAVTPGFMKILRLSGTDKIIKIREGA